MPPVVSAATARSTLAGFYLSGVLMSFLGAILPAWDYHLQSAYFTIGYYFLAMNAGMLLSVPLARAILRARTIGFALILASSLAAASFFYLAAVGPPRLFWWRAAGLLVMGMAGGLLNAALFTAVSPVYRRDPAATINLSGLLFGLGCLSTSLLVSGTFYIYTTGSILILLGLFPAFLAAKYARWKRHDEQLPAPVPLRQAISDFQSPAAVLFALLLFFQFGNEWSIAGWLPVFLAQRLGASPADCVLMLSLYWLALTLGRIVSQSVLPRVHHGKLLMGSVLAALLGCFILSLTEDLFGAGAGIVITGLGFAPIYPLVVEKIGSRFSYYHPGVFNGLFSLAVTGGLLAPASLGWIASWFGVGSVMLVPVVGSCAVFILLVVIFLEDKLTRMAAAKSQT
ncbi:MAG: MFS transporter [Bryobacteraceae bacterium]|nr:MFS transporter [Bryobacteraceae bacterium]